MSRCPNCSYILKLLEKRSKYKCAKCGKLFSQKEIDNKDFREYNKREKDNDRIEFQRQFKLKRKRLKAKKLDPKLVQKKLKEWKAAYYANNKEKFKKINFEYYMNHRDELLTKSRERYSENTEEILKRNKAYRTTNKDKVKLAKDKYRLSDMEQTRLNQRINDWRQAQGKLVLSYF